jgi:hypothetical protein
MELLAISCFDRHARSSIAILLQLFLQSTALHVHITPVQKISQEPHQFPEVRLHLSILVSEGTHC